jgi:hypothetical protein
MPYLKNRAVVLVKIEAGGYGIDAEPTAAANAILCSEPEIEPIVKDIERNHVRQSFGSKPKMKIGEGYKISFKTEIMGGGAAGTPPPFGPLLRACGLTETINAGVDVDYDPSSDSFNGESVTVWFYRHGKLHKAVGCRGTVPGLETKTNELAMLSFEFTGIYAGPIDEALPVPVYPATIPPVFRSAALTIHGYAAVVESLKISDGGSVARRPDANAATGILEYYISDRLITGELDPEVTAIADKDFWAIWQAGTQGAFTAAIGTVVGNRCVISGPKVQLDDLKYADRENLLTYAMPLIFISDAGDDEIQFKFN